MHQWHCPRNTHGFYSSRRHFQKQSKQSSLLNPCRQSQWWSRNHKRDHLWVYLKSKTHEQTVITILQENWPLQCQCSGPAEGLIFFFSNGSGLCMLYSWFSRMKAYPWARVWLVLTCKNVFFILLKRTFPNVMIIFSPVLTKSDFSNIFSVYKINLVISHEQDAKNITDICNNIWGHCKVLCSRKFFGNIRRHDIWARLCACLVMT